MIKTNKTITFLMPSIRGAVSTLSPVRLPFGLSCSLHLPFRLSCSLHLPFGWSCSLLLPFGWSCSLLLPFRSSCTLYLPETCRSLPATPLMRSLARKDTPERGAMSSIPPPPPKGVSWCLTHPISLTRPSRPPESLPEGPGKTPISTKRTWWQTCIVPS